MAIGRTVIRQGPTLYVNEASADVHGAPGAWMARARVVARSILMLAFAAFAILVLLPAAVAAQAAISI